ncbi:MAG: DUF2141 domain-containing protein [Pirellulales bacterium]|nr:DUF2141 domain-containing protein [Pirellulales bacterium]
MENNDPQPFEAPTLWQENHGNLLLVFMAFIVIAGASILIYRQTRFVPPRFPDGKLIQNQQLDQSNAATSLIDLQQPAVVVEVSGAISDVGVMMVAIYESEETFNRPSNALLRESLDIKDGVSRWIIPVSDLPEKFAIAAYHDENIDGNLNRNRVGIPIERYGYSRNARGLTGPPRYLETVISRPAAGKKIEVFVR